MKKHIVIQSLDPFAFTTCSISSVPRYGTTSVVSWGAEKNDLEGRVHKLERKLGGGRRMNLYEVFVVDTKKLVVLSQQTVFGEDESDAMADVSLTDEQKALKKRQRIAILAREIGEFEPFAVVHVETESDE